MKTCRHRKTWLIAGGLMEWCYQCGALRQMRRIEDSVAVTPDGRWRRPVGPDGENPWQQWERDNKAYNRQRGR